MGRMDLIRPQAAAVSEGRAWEVEDGKESEIVCVEEPVLQEYPEE